MHEPWMLFLLIAAPLLMIVNWRRGSRRGSRMFAGFSLGAFALLVSKPELVRRESKKNPALAGERFATVPPAESEQMDKRQGGYPGSCFVLVLEKSSAMEGKQMALETLAALEIAENLKRNDMIGVLTFDDSFHWRVPIRSARLEDPIDRDIDGITASGGTNIAPALAEAVRSILPIKTATKHIILFTDGRSEDIDSLTLARRAALRHVTISTVGLGARENRRYLETVARWAGGESYVITDPLEVERTIVRDTIARSRFIELGTDHWPAPIRDPAGR